MKTTAVPLYETIDRRNSCVVEARFHRDGLLIVIEVFPIPGSPSKTLKISFPHDRGFVLLDEGDMPSWLTSECFRSEHILYSITSGGWFSNLNSNDSLLQIAGASCREWLVVTANECVSIFSSAEPTVIEVQP